MATSPLHILPSLLEAPMRAVQRTFGPKGMAWVFLAPNLIIFGTFTFLPILLNFGYATTGGGNILLGDRPFVGSENFRSLLSCTNYLDPSSCERDLFWRAVFNTGLFVVLQVGGMILLSLGALATSAIGVVLGFRRLAGRSGREQGPAPG